ncbi:MAG: hypothetical protein ACK2T6_07440 [Anaerolineae bacterium]
MGRVAYRVGQFVTALDAAVRPPDPGPARERLDGSLQEVFERMPAADRRHGLTVLAELQAAGETDAVLLATALLHDCGKAESGVTVVHRVLRVLLSPTVPGLWARLTSCPTGWRRPFWVVANHPARGAAWVAACGGPPEMVELIRHHEEPLPEAWRGTAQARRHAALAAVDART